jgi:hypothetical protein
MLPAGNTAWLQNHRPAALIRIGQRARPLQWHSASRHSSHNHPHCVSLALFRSVFLPCGHGIEERVH